MEIIVKEYNANELALVRKLIDLLFEEVIFHVLQHDKYIFAYTAFLNKTLIGIIIGWQSELHPYCTYFRLVSDPVYGTYDVEKKLLAKAENLEGLTYPLQTSIWETSLNLKKVYKNHHLKEVRRTYMPTLKVKDYPSSLHTNKPNINTLATISLNDEQMDKLVALVKKNYEQTHRINPVKVMEISDWKELILADDIVMQGSYVYLDEIGSDIKAYALMHESDKEHTYELGWCGCAGKQNKGLIFELVKQQIYYARQKSVKYLTGEFDTTDCDAMEVLRAFSFAPSPALVTYQKKHK